MPPEQDEGFENEKIERLQRAMYSRSLSDKLRDRPRRELDDLQPAVAEDFHTPVEESPRSIIAPHYIGLARTALWWLLGAAIIFFIAAAGFFAYYFSFGGGSVNASASNIEILVSGPPEIQSGEVTNLFVTVTNKNSIPLNLADLVFAYPSGTRSAADFKTDWPGDRISLGTIKPGETRQGKVPVVFNGTQNAQQMVKVELDYHISGSNAVFVAPTTYTLNFASSPVLISVDGNDQTISGQPVQFTVTVASNTTAPVSDVVASAQYPFGFKLTSSSPTPDSAGLWELGTLAPGQRKTITILGTLTGEEGDSRVFNFTAGTRTSATDTTVTTPLSTNAFTMTVSKPFLGLTVGVNGASQKNVAVSPGGAVSVSISWQNNLPTAITSAVIVAKLSGLPIDGTTVRSPTGFYRSSDNVVLWDKTTDPSLANLAPGAQGVASFSFLMPTSDELKNIVNPSLDISINAAGDRVSETGVPQSLQASADQHLTLASDLQVKAQGLYYSNPFGSTGPMPPKANTETTYGIVFTVTNTTNKITDAKLVATLPPYVRWVGIYSPSSEKVSFNQLNSTVTWDIGDIEPGVGIGAAAPKQSAIAIGFTPSTSQIGQKPSLLQNIVLYGTDTSTNQPLGGIDPTTNKQIGLPVPDVTTNITSDPGFSTANAEVVK
jgi:hypothetical protein